MLAGRQRHHEEYRTAGECHQGWATRPTMHRSIPLGLKPCVGICAAARVGSGGNQGLVVAVNHAYSVAADIVQPHPVLGGVLGGPGPVEADEPAGAPKPAAVPLMKNAGPPLPGPSPSGSSSGKPPANPVPPSAWPECWPPPEPAEKSSTASPPSPPTDNWTPEPTPPPAPPWDDSCTPSPLRSSPHPRLAHNQNGVPNPRPVPDLPPGPAYPPDSLQTTHRVVVPTPANQTPALCPFCTV